jgi:hypothetical protein
MLFSKMIRAFALMGLVMSAVVVPSQGNTEYYKRKPDIGSGTVAGAILGSALAYTFCWAWVTPSSKILSTSCIASGAFIGGLSGYFSESRYAKDREAYLRSFPLDPSFKKAQNKQHRRDYAWAYQDLPTKDEYRKAREEV